MQKIIPHLWFNNQAEEAASLYTSIFENSKTLNITHYGKAGAEVSGRLENSVMTVTFQLDGQEFIALNGGPTFTFTPAISFFVNCETGKEIDALWETLSDGGETLMPLDNYPFSDRFGWVNDKFGVSWQLNLASGGQKIIPFLMYVGEQHGRAEEAVNLYTSLFDHSSMIKIEHYNAGEEEPEGTVKHATFSLHGQEFMAMDSSLAHGFTFTEAISFFVNCETQEEVDELWAKLTENGEPQPCGWLKDQYGVSWQIVPTVLSELLNDPEPEKSERVAEALFQMKKIDIEKLKQAYRQG